MYNFPVLLELFVSWCAAAFLLCCTWLPQWKQYSTSCSQWLASLHPPSLLFKLVHSNLIQDVSLHSWTTSIFPVILTHLVDSSLMKKSCIQSGTEWAFFFCSSNCNYFTVELKCSTAFIAWLFADWILIKWISGVSSSCFSSSLCVFTVLLMWSLCVLTRGSPEDGEKATVCASQMRKRLIWLEAFYTLVHPLLKLGQCLFCTCHALSFSSN